MTNKIIHGNRNFGYAPINVSDEGVMSFGTPIMMGGMVSSNVEVEQDETKIYADDKVWVKSKGAKVRTAELTFKYVDKAYLQYLGYKLNSNGMLTDTGKFPSHCIFFEETEEDSESNSTQTLYILYNVKASQPTIETATDEEELEAKDIAISYSADDSEFVVDDDGEYAQLGTLTRTSENAELYDTFKQAIILPTSTK